MNSNKTENQDRFIAIKEVSSLTTLSGSTIRKLTGQGMFPEKITLSRNKVVWSSLAVQDWIASKIEGRDWIENSPSQIDRFAADIKSGRYNYTDRRV